MQDYKTESKVANFPKLAKVHNMLSPSGSKVANQFEIMVQGVGTYFQSYDSVIALHTVEGDVYLDENNWDYNTTTSKYRNQFLGETKKETQAKMDSGEYMLTNLN